VSTVIRFMNHEVKDVVLEGQTDIAIHASGLVVVQQEGQIIGLFPAGHVAGVYHPEGASQVQLAPAGVKLVQ
jgi:succinate dehydrogenase/fumarate reductase flavoprotein subunit